MIYHEKNYKDLLPGAKVKVLLDNGVIVIDTIMFNDDDGVLTCEKTGGFWRIGGEGISPSQSKIIGRVVPK